ncbi:phosphatidylethanolamine methyltransferase [Aspergillus luchuensis]|uniref:Phosphatidylethanolamine methyltransferase n=1 Tax=Aspergillus kawachii TaxID=1069201 RepID=A0A146F0Q7_ASPKA|nr:phosphatidylethanolamine methyltransferase [Aspergillus luchuensis]
MAALPDSAAKCRHLVSASASHVTRILPHPIGKKSENKPEKEQAAKLKPASATNDSIGMITPPRQVTLSPSSPRPSDTAESRSSTRLNRTGQVPSVRSNSFTLNTFHTAINSKPSSPARGVADRSNSGSALFSCT